MAFVRAGPRYLLGRLAGARHFRKVCRIRLALWILARPRTYNPWPYHRRHGDFQPEPLRFSRLDQAPLWAISRGAGQAPAPRRRLLFVNSAHGTFPVHHRQSRQRRQRGAGSNFLLDYVRRLSARICGVRLCRDPHAVAERTVHPRRRLVVRQTTDRGARHQRGLPFRISIRRSETGPTQR